jgi:hypothetical protein
MIHSLAPTKIPVKISTIPLLTLWTFKACSLPMQNVDIAITTEKQMLNLLLPISDPVADTNDPSLHQQNYLLKFSWK